MHLLRAYIVTGVLRGGGGEALIYTARYSLCQNKNTACGQEVAHLVLGHSIACAARETDEPVVPTGVTMAIFGKKGSTYHERKDVTLRLITAECKW